MKATERLLQHAGTESARDAVVSATITWSYAELARRVLAKAEQLGDAGISSQSVVGVRCTDDVQHLVLSLAISHLNATSLTIPPHESETFRRSLAGRCGITHFVSEDRIEKVSANSTTEQVAPEAARLLFSTSGTTGEPKLVIHHDTDLVAQSHRHIYSREERFACLASMEHNFAKRHRLYCVAVGATNVFLDTKHNDLVAQCRSLGVNVLHVSAFQAQELLAVPDIGNLSDIRLKLGGSHVPLKLREQLRSKITKNLQAGYGTTETGAIGFTDPIDSDAGESVGQPLPGIEVRIVGPDRAPLSTGERGEIAIRCDGMFRGYLGRDDLTAERLRDDWFFTGDTGYLDSERRIHLCGRQDDMFVFNSMNIYPQEIETQICKFPNVKESLVVPKDSSVHGRIPMAFVVLEEGTHANLSELQAFVQASVGARSPRQITIVDSLPRNTSGKLSRRSASTLFKKDGQIRQAIVDVLSAEATRRMKASKLRAFFNGDADITLRDVELDSFARMEIMVMLELEYGALMTPEKFARLGSLGKISAWVMSAPSEGNSTLPDTPEATSERTDDRHAPANTYLLRLFGRVFRHCHTAAQLNKALGTFEHRLTPLDVCFLRELHVAGRVLPDDAGEKFHAALSAWFEKMSRQMSDSGKQQTEPFEANRITSTATHFFGPGDPEDKTLIICFANKGARHLMMPNAVLMQHTDSSQFDLLVITEPLTESYRLGVPALGKNVDEVIDWIANLDLVREYRAIRTIGCSAGAYMAVLAGFRLQAELAVSVAGRFHSERYAHRIIGRVIKIWRTARKGGCSQVLMSYPADKHKSRDRIYAKIIGYLTGGSLLGLEFQDAEVGHLILHRLVERGELASYLNTTIFADIGGELETGVIRLIRCDRLE